MEEHCPKPGLPARGDYVIVAQALSQVSQVTILGTTLILRSHY